MTTALERLEQLLDNKDAEIEELKHQLKAFQRDENESSWVWTKHGSMSQEENGELPVPRLELRYNKCGESWYNRECWYYLVYRHFLGNLVCVPLGHTEVNGGNGEPPIHDDEVDLPFRDGAHIKSDAKHMKLPAYAICQDTINVLYTVGG